MAKGKVVAGDYIGYEVIAYGDKCYFMKWLKKITVDRYVVAKCEHVSDISTHSHWKTLAKSAVGGMLFGAAGLFAGAAARSIKKSYLISVEFTDGRRSLIEADVACFKSVMRAIY